VTVNYFGITEGTGSDWVGIVMLIVAFTASKPVKQIVYEIVSTVIIFKVGHPLCLCL